MILELILLYLVFLAIENIRRDFLDFKLLDDFRNNLVVFGIFGYRKYWVFEISLELCWVLEILIVYFLGGSLLGVLVGEDN
jgi:hypothetical protein